MGYNGPAPVVGRRPDVPPAPPPPDPRRAMAANPPPRPADRREGSGLAGLFWLALLFGGGR